MQVTSRKDHIPLDNITTKTDVMQVVDHGEIEAQPEDGAYVHGWFLQGARWGVNAQMLKESILKELFPSMPVVHLSAIPKETAETTGFFVCPVYTTASRGAAVFVFPAGLKTNENPYKWVLAGVAILQQV